MVAAAAAATHIAAIMDIAPRVLLDPIAKSGFVAYVLNWRLGFLDYGIGGHCVKFAGDGRVLMSLDLT